MSCQLHVDVDPLGAAISLQCIRARCCDDGNALESAFDGGEIETVPVPFDLVVATPNEDQVTGRTPPNLVPGSVGARTVLACKSTGQRHIVADIAVRDAHATDNQFCGVFLGTEADANPRQRGAYGERSVRVFVTGDLVERGEYRAFRRSVRVDKAAAVVFRERQNCSGIALFATEDDSVDCRQRARPVCRDQFEQAGGEKQCGRVYPFDRGDKTVSGEWRAAVTHHQ